MTEIQDFCEDCGRSDLHLKDGLCADCLSKYERHDINDGEHACNDEPHDWFREAYRVLATEESDLAWRESLNIEVGA